MPAKKTAKLPSHEDAQKKLWMLEIRDSEKAVRKVKTDWRNEQKRLIATCESANKALNRFMARAEKQMPKQLSNLERRIGILKGKVGI